MLSGIVEQENRNERTCCTHMYMHTNKRTRTHKNVLDKICRNVLHNSCFDKQPFLL